MISFGRRERTASIRERAEALVQGERAHVAGRRPKGRRTRMQLSIRLDPEIVLLLLAEDALISDAIDRLVRQRARSAA